MPGNCSLAPCAVIGVECVRSSGRCRSLLAESFSIRVSKELVYLHRVRDGRLPPIALAPPPAQSRRASSTAAVLSTRKLGGKIHHCGTAIVGRRVPAGDRVCLCPAATDDTTGQPSARASSHTRARAWPVIAGVSARGARASEVRRLGARGRSGSDLQGKSRKMPPGAARLECENLRPPPRRDRSPPKLTRSPIPRLDANAGRDDARRDEDTKGGAEAHARYKQYQYKEVRGAATRAPAAKIQRPSSVSLVPRPPTDAPFPHPHFRTRVSCSPRTGASASRGSRPARPSRCGGASSLAPSATASTEADPPSSRNA